MKKINNDRERDEYFKCFRPDYTMIEEYTEYPNEIGVTYLFDSNTYTYVSCIKRTNHQETIIHYRKEYFNNIWEGNTSGTKRENLLTIKTISRIPSIVATRTRLTRRS